MDKHNVPRPSSGQREGGSSKKDLAVRIHWDEHNPLRKQGRFMCHVRFKNDLPEIPCDAKMLLPPLNPRALAAFSLTSVEKELKRDMLFPSDLGIPITALDIERYSVPDNPAANKLHPADAALLVDDKVAANARGGAAGAKDVTWLMRTKYMTAEGVGGARRPSAATKAAAAAAAAAATIAADDQENDVAAQIAHIETSFDHARRPPKNPKNPDAIPLQVLPVLPDEVMAGRSLVFATYDGDPIADQERIAQLPEDQRQRMESSTQLKSFKHKQSQFIAMLLPTDRVPPAAADANGESASASATQGVSIRGEDLVGDYSWVRAYDFNLKFEDRGQTFLLRFADDHVGYSDLSTKLQLKKRKRSDDDDDEAFLQPEKFNLAMTRPEEDGAPEEEEEEQLEQPLEAGVDGTTPTTQEEASHPPREANGTAADGADAGDAIDVDAPRDGADAGGGEDDIAATKLKAVFGSDDDDD